MSEFGDARPLDESDAPDVDGTAPADGSVDDAEATLQELPDGSGCTEIWEHLSDRRRRD